MNQRIPNLELPIIQAHQHKTFWKAPAAPHKYDDLCEHQYDIKKKKKPPLFQRHDTQCLLVILILAQSLSAMMQVLYDISTNVNKIGYNTICGLLEIEASSSSEDVE